MNIFSKPHYSPLDNHIDYVLKSHNDSCRYEQGECPEPLCSHYEKYVNEDYDHTYETDDTMFFQGEVLYPDYVHRDTLIVVNADSLNWAMRYYDAASDGDIADILKAYTAKTDEIFHSY